MDTQEQIVDILGQEVWTLSFRKFYGLVLKEAGKDCLAKQAQQGNAF